MPKVSEIFIGYRAMQQNGDWPSNMEYISCDDFDGTNTPDRDIDLRTAFVNIQDIPICGNFTFPPPNMPFNGHSWMKFKMDFTAITVLGGTTVNVKPLGNWTADISAPIHVNSIEEMANLTAAQVYRVFTVVVSSTIFIFDLAMNWYLLLTDCSNHHSS